MVDKYLLLNKAKIDKTILKEVKKKKEIVYGAQSIKKQIGFLGRPTIDWDILSKTPEQSAKQTEKELETLHKGEQFFVKEALHKGTYKVQYLGKDKKKNTKDDIGVADYTKLKSKVPPTKLINGIRYRTLTQEGKAKRSAIKDEDFAFRREKDTEDLNRIKLKKVIFD